MRDNGNEVGVNNRKPRGVQGDYLSAFHTSAPHWDTVVGRSQMLVCSSAASPTGRNDVSHWMLSLLYLSTSQAVWEEDLSKPAWQIWHLTAEWVPLLNWTDSLLILVQSLSWGGWGVGSGEEGNRMEQPSVYSKFDMYRKCGCIHFLVYHVKVLWKRTKQKNCTSASISFDTLKHIVVQHGWRQCQTGYKYTNSLLASKKINVKKKTFFFLKKNPKNGTFW